MSDRLKQIRRTAAGGILITADNALLKLRIEFDAAGNLVEEPECIVHPQSPPSARVGSSLQQQRAAICQACESPDCPMKRYKPCHAKAIRARPNAQCPDGKWPTDNSMPRIENV
ncbi:MAG: hypothetical protein MI741_17870 [Rhodospirillales bacterium]|nr:hypothetical protein [Rhodospirillales bacterium]